MLCKFIFDVRSAGGLGSPQRQESFSHEANAPLSAHAAQTCCCACLLVGVSVVAHAPCCPPSVHAELCKERSCLHSFRHLDSFSLIETQPVGPQSGLPGNLLVSECVEEPAGFGQVLQHSPWLLREKGLVRLHPGRDATMGLLIVAGLGRGRKVGRRGEGSREDGASAAGAVRGV